MISALTSRTPPQKTGHAPTYLANALNGLGAVHFTAGTSATDSQSLNFTRAGNLRSVFSVFKGSSFLLTDTAACDFHRPNDTDPAAPLWAPAALNLNNGTLRLAGDATLAIGGVLTNVGLLDVMTWNGTLPAGFINLRIVLD